MFTDGTTLMSLLSPEDPKAVEKALDERGIPPASVAKMKPWMLSAMVALPACELARKAAGAPVLDVKLAEDAKAAGKKLEGLETVADQLSAMASLPMEFHMKGLVDTLKLGDRIDDVDRDHDRALRARGYRHVLAAVPRRAAEATKTRRATPPSSRRWSSAQQDDDRATPSRSSPGQRLHRGRRAASARPGRADRAVPQGRLHRHRCRRLRSIRTPLAPASPER